MPDGGDAADGYTGGSGGTGGADPWADDLGPYLPAPSQGDPLRAFLWAIRNAEHRRADVTSGLDYATTYGGTRLVSLDDHPTVTGEWLGRTLPDTLCRAAGQRLGCKSTAAGAYQIIRPTWDRVRKAGAWGPYLGDFSPQAQDEAARRLLIECGALARIEAGDIEGAIARAAPVWASLPGSTAGQGGRSVGEVLAFYDEGLRNG